MTIKNLNQMKTLRKGKENPYWCQRAWSFVGAPRAGFRLQRKVTGELSYHPPCAGWGSEIVGGETSFCEKPLVTMREK
jgi:hypothetical protein